MRDLPLLDVVVSLETTTLADVCAAFGETDCRWVLVLDVEGAARGVVARAVVERHVARLSDLRVGMLPLQGVVEVSAAATVREAVLAIAAPGVEVLVCRHPGPTDPQLVSRDAVMGQPEWAPHDVPGLREALEPPAR
ncbi:MAG: hypothetical protein INH41_07275 [Myxococcaceae bacterium]|nr:hypothetical protein [Myxococcaceae bacterium]MCA3012187.1 hypothetical protein [Myxococcaceae bacterium]